MESCVAFVGGTDGAVGRGEQKMQTLSQLNGGRGADHQLQRKTSSRVVEERTTDYRVQKRTTHTLHNPAKQKGAALPRQQVLNLCNAPPWQFP